VDRASLSALARGIALSAALSAALSLTGCAVPRGPSLTGSDGAHTWTGRFAATWMLAGTPLREERASGRFELYALGEAAEMEILSPLGQTLLRATARPGRATIETADGRAHQAANAQALTEEFLGWRVPIERLPRWLSGRIGAPGAAAPDAGGEVRSVDDGWRITASQWTAGRPLRLTLSWPSDAGTDDARRVEIRLAVDADVQ